MSFGDPRTVLMSETRRSKSLALSQDQLRRRTHRQPHAYTEGRLQPGQTAGLEPPKDKTVVSTAGTQG